MAYTGLLRSADSQDSMRVNLTIEGEILHAGQPGGATWDIALERVGLVRWSDRELQLELAGETVEFVPDDPDAVLEGLLPVLLARRQPGVAAAGGPPAPLEPTPNNLVVDLTRPEPIAPTSGAGSEPWVEPRSTEPGRTRPVAPAPRRRLRMALVWALAAAVLAAGAFIAVSLGSGAGPEERARAALNDAGFASVTVVVDGGIALLTGTVDSPDEAQAAANALSEVDGIDRIANQIQARTTGSPDAPPDTTVPTVDPEAPAVLAGDVEAALTAAGIDSLETQTDGSLVVVGGSVASEADRRAALAVLFDVEGVEEVDNRITVEPVPDETIASAARTALDEAGFQTVAVAVENGLATLTGVVPLDALNGGFFSYSNGVEGIVVEQDGVQGIRNRLQLTGDAATLRDQLRSLTESAPITFALGDSALTAAGRATLDSAAGIIQAQPGLRVLIAGHTDTTGSAGFNEQLSQERADAVRQYLIDRGIAANRLAVVAYGELFPSTPGEAPQDRRVEFEVAG